jgi:hypothetical protein
MNPDDDSTPKPPDDETPGGPYFGRLLIVLFLAVVFCGVLTWVISSYFEH